MKQIKLFLSLLLMGAMAVSCKKEDNNADAILLTKIIATEGEGKTTSLYEYDGRKLKTITKTMEYGNESITTVYTYTYTGDDITKIVESNEDGMIKSQSFIHAGGKLLMWSENYDTNSDSCFYCETVVTVDYNADGSQTVKYYDNYNTPSSFLKKIFNITFNNEGNEITELDSGGSGFTYMLEKGKSAPHKNILGWDKLMPVSTFEYAPETIKKIKKYIYNREFSTQSISYEYNSNGFPTSKEASSGYYEYFYNK